MGNAARVSLVLVAVLALCGCSIFTPARERELKRHYAANDYPRNPVPGLNKVGLVVLDASLAYHPDLQELSTAFFVQLQSIEGLEVFPTAVTLAAMEELSLASAKTNAGFVLPRDGLMLADKLHADGVFVAVVTDYNPYGEPVIALGLMLFSRATSPLGALDRQQLDKIRQGGKPLDLPTSPATSPVTAVFAVYDVSQKTTRRTLELYALGQTAGDVGLGWERYYRSMPNYMRFAAYETVWKLFDQLQLAKARRGVNPVR